MLTYIPETSVPHPRVRAVRQVAEDLMESSESQEESDVTPRKPRKHKVTKSVTINKLCLSSVYEICPSSLVYSFILCSHKLQLKGCETNSLSNFGLFPEKNLAFLCPRKNVLVRTLPGFG